MRSHLHQQKRSLVFLSFTGKDATEPLSDKFKNELDGKFNVYRINDATGAVGRQQHAEIMRKIGKAVAFLVIVGPEYQLRPWCIFEFCLALEEQVIRNKTFIFPVLVGKDESDWLPKIIRLELDAQKNEDKEVRRISKSVSDSIEKAKSLPATDIHQFRICLAKALNVLLSKGTLFPSFMCLSAVSHFGGLDLL